MADSTLADRFRIARLVTGDAVGRAWRGVGAPWRRIAALRARAPERLLISTQDIRTSDPTVAADIYAGYFAFSGKVVNTHGKSPFEIAPPSPAWAASLASFIWLRHLRAADTALARANARALVDDFLALAAKNPGLPIWEPRIAARRLLAWLCQAPMILEGADRDFYQRFMKALARHGARLQCALGDGAQGETRLLVLTALATLGLSAAGMDNLMRRSTRLLARELALQILPDGGHISRNPQALIDLLLDLLPLRQLYAARGVAAPQELLNSIDRMLPMLRLLRHSGGSIARFNGMSATSPHALATVLAYDDALAAAPLNAPHSGYQRLEGGTTILIMDTGASPPSRFSSRTHAGQLSFELASEGHDIISNCGASNQMRPDLRAAGRMTAAHSTLTIEDYSSSRFAAETGAARRLAGRIVSAQMTVKLSRQDAPEGPGLVASHDGYARNFGLVHERSLRLAADGSSLAGVDLLRPANSKRKNASANYALRFHLHPAVRAERAENGRSVMLTLPNGAIWLFHADGLPLEVEPSISFAAAGGARGTDQIVINATAAQAPGVNWSFERLAGRVEA